MTARGQSPRLLRFGTFELNPASNELRRAGALIKLQGQQFQLLVLLAERAGEVVTREQIRQTLWDDQTFVDFDRAINFCINQIRGALGDDPQSPRYIETLPRKGYRFIAPVDVCLSADASAGEGRSGGASNTTDTLAAVVTNKADLTRVSAKERRLWLLEHSEATVLLVSRLSIGVMVVLAIAAVAGWF